MKHIYSAVTWAGLKKFQSAHELTDQEKNLIFTVNNLL